MYSKKTALIIIQTFQVVDPQTNEEVGVGKTGEILIKTPSMMAKYLLNEENPTSPIDKNGFYHTGDIGYVTSDDNVYITGRIKELIKVKNHQVTFSQRESFVWREKTIADSNGSTRDVVTSGPGMFVMLTVADSTLVTWCV